MIARRRRLGWFVATALMFGYVTSYVVLSRIGIAKAREFDLAGYYFAEPSTDAGLRLNSALRILYMPLVDIDIWAALGPGCDPMKGLQ
jgi:hypothetical protein